MGICGGKVAGLYRKIGCKYAMHIMVGQAVLFLIFIFFFFFVLAA